MKYQEDLDKFLHVFNAYKFIFWVKVDAFKLAKLISMSVHSAIADSVSV